MDERRQHASRSHVALGFQDFFRGFKASSDPAQLSYFLYAFFHIFQLVSADGTTSQFTTITDEHLLRRLWMCWSSLYAKIDLLELQLDVLR